MKLKIWLYSRIVWLFPSLCEPLRLARQAYSKSLHDEAENQREALQREGSRLQDAARAANIKKGLPCVRRWKGIELYEGEPR